MKIAYNPTGGSALSKSQIDSLKNDIIFDLSGMAVYARGIPVGKVYLPFEKSTSSTTEGYNGLVPFPDYNGNSKTRFLREDGTWVVPTNTNNYRPISVNGTSILENNNTALNLVAGTNITLNPKKDSNNKYTGEVTITASNHAWSNITGKPTTLAGYGITDAVKWIGEVNADSVYGASVGYNTDSAAPYKSGFINVGKGYGFLLQGRYGKHLIYRGFVPHTDSTSENPKNTFEAWKYILDENGGELKGALTLQNSQYSGIKNSEGNIILGAGNSSAFVGAVDDVTTIVGTNLRPTVLRTSENNLWHYRGDKSSKYLILDTANASSHVVDLTSNQTISGKKSFKMFYGHSSFNILGTVNSVIINYSETGGWDGGYMIKSGDKTMTTFGVHGSNRTPYYAYVSLNGEVGDTNPSFKFYEGGKLTHKTLDVQESAHTNLVTNLNADMVDGYDSLSLFTNESIGDVNAPNKKAHGSWIAHLGSHCSNVPSSCDDGKIVHFSTNPNAGTSFQLASSYYGNTLFFRSGDLRESSQYYLYNKAWKKVAFTDSDITGNAASATKLETSRTIWGLSFDGTKNVQGALSGATTITTSGNITTGNSTTTSNLAHTVENNNGKIGIYASARRGLYDYTIGNWLIGTDGTNTRLMIGNIGIGTDSPLYKLHVAGTTLTDRLFIGGLSHPMIIGNGSLLSLGAANSSSKASVVLDLNTDSFRRNSASTTISLGTSTYPWVNVHGINYYGSTLIITNTGFGPLEIKRNADNGNPAIKYSNKSETLGYIGISGFDNSNKGLAYRWNSDYSHMYKIFDSGNSSVEGGGNTGGSSITVNLGGTSKTLTIPTSLPANGGVANKLKNLGKHSEVASSTTVPSDLFEGAYYNSGMFMTSNMNDGTTPSSFGNIINVLGNGGSLLLLGWEGSYKTGNIYYRSHRDMVNSGGWTPWRLLAFIDSLVDTANTANTANKLTTARTINVSIGGTTGTAQSFDGSSNITIPVSGMGEAYLTWGGKNISGDISPIDAAASLLHSANKFELANPDGIIIEYSTDSGTTWLEYSTTDEAKVNLVSAKETWYLYGGSSTVSLSGRLRVTLIASSMNVYTSLKKLLINCSTNGSTGCTVTVETSKNGAETTFSTIGTYNISGYSGWNSIPCGFAFGGLSYQTNNTARIRLTFSHTSLSSSLKTNPKIGNINAIGTTNWACPSTIARTGHLYSYDYLGNATFPKNIITSGKIIATTFNGESMLILNSDLNAFRIKRNSTSSGAYVTFENTNGRLGILGLTNAKELYLYKGTDESNPFTIYHSGNSSVTGGGSNWGSSITINLGSTSKTLTIPSKPSYSWTDITDKPVYSWSGSSPLDIILANYGTMATNLFISAYLSHGSGSIAMGYKISGYESTPYGGWFGATYSSPWFIGASCGIWTLLNIMTDTNYTSYTVKKDGTGASGTWGINITGNAATATWADKLDGLHKDEFQQAVYTYFPTTYSIANTTTLANIISPNITSDSDNFKFYDTKFYGTVSSTSNRAQIAYGYKYDGIHFRRYYNGAWTAWKEVAFKETTLSGYGITDAVKIATKSANVSESCVGYTTADHNLQNGGLFTGLGADGLYGSQLLGNYVGTGLYYRGKNNGTWTAWKTVAFTDSNVASADKVDGYDSSVLFTCESGYGLDVNAPHPKKELGTLLYRMSANCANIPPGCTNGVLVHFNHPSTDTAFQLVSNYSNTGLYYRSGSLNESGTTYLYNRTWKQLAFTDSNITGNAASATITGDSTMTIIPLLHNEINFGGTNNSLRIYFGYRATDSKPIPTSFIFGGSDGSASLSASKFITTGGTSSQFVKGDGSLDSNTYVSETEFPNLSSKGLYKNLTSSGDSNINKWKKFARINLSSDKVYAQCGGYMFIYDHEGHRVKGILDFHVRTEPDTSINKSNINLQSPYLKWHILDNSNYASNIKMVKVENGIFDLYITTSQTYTTLVILVFTPRSDKITLFDETWIDTLPENVICTSSYTITVPNATTATKLANTLTFSAGAFVTKTYNGSSATTVNIPTHTSHLTNNSFAVHNDAVKNVTSLTRSTLGYAYNSGANADTFWYTAGPVSVIGVSKYLCAIQADASNNNVIKYKKVVNGSVQESWKTFVNSDGTQIGSSVRPVYVKNDGSVAPFILSNATANDIRNILVGYDNGIYLVTSAKINPSTGILTANGFVKSGSTDSHILLGAGGHKAISDFVLKSEFDAQELSSNLTTITIKSLAVRTDWMDTGIIGSYKNESNTLVSGDLETGTYIVQVYCSGAKSGGTSKFYNCYWSGVMSWYSGTNSTDSLGEDEILLHRSGHADSNCTIYLRTKLLSGNKGLKLLIAANQAMDGAKYTFKFKRVI